MHPESPDQAPSGVGDRLTVSLGTAPRISMKLATSVLIVVVLLVLWWAFQTSARPLWQSSTVPVANANETVPANRVYPEVGIIIHISGAVQNPGVYELPPDSRVIDVVQRAGGFRDDADPAAINLARIVHDSEQVNIPKLGESVNTGSAGNGTGLVNINTADQAALDTLPRIGPSLAERIIQYRERYGPFRDLESLLGVSGIGPAVIEDIRDKITF